jgi:hypothetical protein
MNIRHLEKRLRKVESTLRCEPSKGLDFIFALLWFAVAFYLGNPSRDEKPFAAYARALGYATESEFKCALDDNDPELKKKLVAAEGKLLAKFGCRPISNDWNETQDALKRMVTGLPKSYQDQIMKVVTQAKISLTWMRNESPDIAGYIRCFA